MGLSWQFEKKEVDDGPGWNAPVITGFKKNKIKSLICEVLQNSLDNPSEDLSGPVKVVFTQEFISRVNLPGAGDLESRISHILDQARHTESEDAVEEIQGALNCLSQDQIPYLRISDFNTTGMFGPDTKGNPFHTYVKTEGSSGGPSTRGGSHGHGKAAPLTVSDLRAIFVSTRYKAKGELKSLSMGRTTLMCHDIGAYKYGYHGYWGEHPYKAVEKLPPECSWMQHPKNVTGTTITILGWQKLVHWQARVIGYAMANYFPAFCRDKLELDVAGEVINHSNFHQKLHDNEFMSLLEKHDQEAAESLKLARWYVKCLDAESENVKIDIKQLSPLPGNSECRIVVEDGAPRQMGIIRNNMYICEARRLSSYYTRIPGEIQDFVGLYECKNKKGTEWLRGMEPPEHNDLSSDFLPHSKSETGASALKKLGSALKDFVKKHAKSEIGTGSEVGWMKDFFEDAAGDGAELDPSEDIDPSGRFEITPRPKPIPPMPPLVFIDIEEPEPEPKPEPGPEPGPEPEPGPKPEPGPGPIPPSLPPRQSDDALLHLRIIQIAPLRYRLLARGKRKSTLKFSFWEVGADFDEELGVATTSHGVTENKSVIFTIEKGVNQLDLTFDRHVLGGIRAQGIVG